MQEYTMRRLKHLIEYIAVRAFAGLCAALPLDRASNLGGWMGRTIGPRTGIDRAARAQLSAIFPDLSQRDVDHYITEMWDNLGRTMAEYPHLDTIARTRVTVDDRAHITHDPGFFDHPALFIAGHFANWEVAGPAFLAQTNTPIHLVYRPANNPFVDALMTRFRSLNGALRTLAKSRGGMRAILEGLENNQKIGLLIDQKYTEGIIADFFGHPASSTTIYAQLGQRFHCPVYPAQVVRTGGARFHITIHPPLALFDKVGTPRRAEDVVAEVHAMMFDWARAHPGQWLWVHQRWPKGTIARG